MASQVLFARPAKEREAHERAQRDSETALLRIHRATKTIREMTRIYVERLEGTLDRMDSRT